MTTMPLRRSVPLKATGQAMIATALRGSGWLVVNTMVALGFVMLAVFVVGGCSIEGTMHHLANLSSRYIVADADRQRQFDLIVLWSVFGVFCTSGLLRRHSLMRALFEESSYD